MIQKTVLQEICAVLGDPDYLLEEAIDVSCGQG